MASWRPATGQGEKGLWTTTPSRPTVGDTIWIERVVATPAGWRVRAGPIETTDRVEPLAEPIVEAHADGWRIRYGVVAWSPGDQAVRLPPLWLLGPDGRADSIPGGIAQLALASVLPDTTSEPKPALQPLRLGKRTNAPLAAAVAASAVLFGAGVWWRRRRPRVLPAVPRDVQDPEIPDARWLAAGETRAVVARAGARLRAAIARAVPQAHEGLSTEECIAVLERARADAPIAELRAVLQALAETAFAAVPAADGAALAQRANGLIRKLVP